MAGGPLDKRAKSELSDDSPGELPSFTGNSNGFRPSKLQVKTAELYGRGATLPQIARALSSFLAPPHREEKLRYRYALRKVRQWSETQWFRDMAFEAGIIQADLEAPAITRGLTAKAKRGRVDAAKMVLGLAGRYEEKGQPSAAQVNVLIQGVPRPANRPAIDIDSQPEAEEWDDGIDSQPRA